MSHKNCLQRWGFLMYWYSVLRQHKRKPIEKLKMKLRYTDEIYSVSLDKS
jgi:hypothetical protein